MAHKLYVILLGIGVFAFIAVPGYAQATFSAAATPTTAADIGVAELTGGIQLTVISGTVAAGSFMIQYSAPITNNTASEIIVTGNGLLGGVSLTQLDRANNTVTINVPASSGPAIGSQILLVGVRVALASSDSSVVTATITGTGNALVAGQNRLTVIGSIQEPFSVTLGDALAWTNGTVTNPATSVQIQENYAGALTSSIGLYGETVASQLRITPFPSIPLGVTVTFPATVTSLEDGATFTTASGTYETVPRKDGSTQVIYYYSGVPASSGKKESFRFSVTAVVASPATSGKLLFQVALLPIGIAVPNDEYPSTDIPRYSERIVPDETLLGFGSSELAFPFQSQASGTYTGIAITNPIDARVNVTLTAYDASGNLITGSDITNPDTITMPRMGQIAMVASEIFGKNYNANRSGTIRATAKTTLMPGFYLEGSISGQGLDGTTANVSQMQTWVLPNVYHAGPSPFTLLQLFNPTNGNATATLNLYDSSGNLAATASLPFPAGGTIIRDLRNIFTTVNLDALAGGYVRGTSDAGLVISEDFGNALDTNILQAQSPIQRQSFNIAHFVSGGGYTTEITIVDLDAAVSSNITLTMFDNSGNPIPVAGNPVNLIVPPDGQLIKTVGQLFPSLGTSFTTGYIRIELKPFFVGPFGSIAPIAGSVRFSAADGSSSATLPLYLPVSSNFVYSQVAQNLGYYTGIAIFNPNATMTSLNLDVFTKDGSLVGSYATALRPGQKISSLLYQMIPASLGQIGGYVHVQSDQPVVSFSLFGTDDGKALSAIPPQDISQ